MEDEKVVLVAFQTVGSIWKKGCGDWPWVTGITSRD